MANSSLALDAAFHALSDPTRRAVLARLVKDGETTVKELAEPFSLGLPTFLKHLRVLENGGLISSAKVGRVRTCTIVPKRLAEAETWLYQRRRQLEKRLDLFSIDVESLERKKKGKVR